MTLDPLVIIGLSMSIVSASMALGVVIIPKLKDWLIPAPKATFLSDFLPFDRVLEDNITILGKDGTLTQTLLIKGIDLSIKTSSEIEALLARRQNWLDMLSEGGACFKLITLRNEFEVAFPSGSKNPVLEKIHDAWMSTFDKTYENKHYLVITSYPKKERGLKGLLGRKSEDANLGILREIVSITCETLHDFDVKVLDNGALQHSPLLSFWASLINGENSSIGSHFDYVSERLVSSTVEFDNEKGLIKYKSDQNEQFSAIVSLKSWGEVSSADLIREIEALPCKLVVLRMCQGYTKLEGTSYLSYQRKQSQLLFENTNTDAEFLNAIEMVKSKEANLYNFQLSIFLFGKDINTLKERLIDVKRIFRNYGFAPVVESMATEWMWRNQFPGIDHFVRPTHPLSHNLAYLLSFEREPVGLPKCDWGDGPLRLFKTPSGGAYSLQLHISEEPEALAHSLVVAPAGSGKTTLYQHLIGGALRHSNLRAYIFDRFNGTRIFTQSIGGTYVDLSSNVALNPLVCDDTEANREFLLNFLLLLAGMDNDEAHERVSNAINILFRIPKNERILSDLFESIVGSNSEVRRGLSKWVGNSPLSRWFNGKSGKLAFDALNLESDRLVAFEMTDVQSSSLTAAAVTHYIMHRIRTQARRHAFPHLIFIDETRPMLTDPIFAKNVATLFLEHRKLRGSINVCFQDAGSIITSGLGSIILEQCPTRFLFPNPAADRKDYEMFNLSHSEWEYIKGTSRISHALKRSVLVKRLNESVILDIDLSSLGPLLQLYRSGSEPVRLVRELQQQWGMEKWTEKYLDLAS